MAITTTTQYEAPVNTVFQRNLLEVAKANAPFFAGTTPGTIMSHSGSFTCTWRRYDRVSAATTPLSELSGNLAFPTRQPQNHTISNVQATLGKYGAFFAMTEEADLLNFTNQNAGISEVLGIQAGQTLNKLQGAEEEDNATAVLAGGVGAANAVVTSISLNDLRKTHNLLDRNNAMRFTERTTGSGNFNTTPIRPSYWAVTHPDVIEDLRLLDQWVPVERYGSQIGTATGEEGYISGFRVIGTTDSTIDAEAGGNSATNTLRTSGNTKVDLYNTVCYGKNAFGSVGLDVTHIKEIYKHGDSIPGIMTIRKARGSAGAADPLNELETVGWKTWHAPSILSEVSGGETLWARCIRSGSKVIS